VSYTAAWPSGLGSAAAWPVVARAQQGDRVRRIGVLTVADENDPVSKARTSAFTQALADLGWSTPPSRVDGTTSDN
jgi:putative ABC transport system substrate-binding protein